MAGQSAPGKSERSVVIGIVKSLEDPENLGRVKVTYPYNEDQESHWFRLCAPFAGPERGAFFRPEVDDEVLVALEYGDPRQGYILGGLWSTSDRPPPDDGKQSENNWRFIRSRSGHLIVLDDTQGAEQVVVTDGSETTRIVLDTANNLVRIESDRGDVEIKAPAGSVKVEATTIEIKATGSASVEAGGTLTLKGATVNIN